jgi:hypothetical protein
MEEKNIQFHIAEYNMLRNALTGHFEAREKLLIYPILANAAVVAWIMSIIGNNIHKPLLELASFLPFLISAISGMIYIGRGWNIRRIEVYCLLLEKNFAVEGLGWQHFYFSEIKSTRFPRRYYLHRIIIMLHTALTIYFLYFMMATL